MMTIECLKRMRHKDACWNHTLKTFIIAVVTLLLGACSDSPGGGGIGGTGKFPETLQTGLLIGPIESTDQFSMNNTEFDVASTSVSVNGDRASYDELHPGMNITARVNYAENKIESIEYQPLLVGSITNLASDLSSFVALDQTVKITASTQYGDLDIHSLYTGAIVEVSGTRDADNNIVASFIGMESSISEQFFIGVVEERLEDSNDVVLSGTTVSLDSIINENELTSSTLDSTLELGTSVKTELDIGAETNGATIVGSDIEMIEEIFPSQNESVSISGSVKSVLDPGSFTINRYTFRTTASTQYFDSSGERLEFYVVEKNDKVLVSGVSVDDELVIAISVTLE